MPQDTLKVWSDCEAYTLSIRHHPAELLPKSVETPAKTAPKREYDLRGHKWPIPWAASRKIIMSSSGEKSVGPVLFEKGVCVWGVTQKTQIFRTSEVAPVSDGVYFLQESLFFRKTRIFTTYSTVPTSGIARRDPPRHGDFDAQIFVKNRLM